MSIGLIDVLIVFVTQFIFIGSRTVNVKAIATGKVGVALLSGAVIHWTWLIGIFYGTVSVADIATSNDGFNWYAVLAIAASTIAGLVATYLGMIEKQKQQKKVEEAREEVLNSVRAKPTQEPVVPRQVIFNRKK